MVLRRQATGPRRHARHVAALARKVKIEAARRRRGTTVDAPNAAPRAMTRRLLPRGG
jgi:hypothetical protein